MLEIFIDGACGPVNPRGAMGCAAIIYQYEADPEGLGVSTGIATEIHRICVGYAPAEINSNNRAEYIALMHTLEWLAKEGYYDAPIVVNSDSQMLVNQILGNWRVKAGLYDDIYDKCSELLEQFSNLSFEWIERCKNGRADVLSKQALRKGINAGKQSVGYRYTPDVDPHLDPQDTF